MYFLALPSLTQVKWAIQKHSRDDKIRPFKDLQMTMQREGPWPYSLDASAQWTAASLTCQARISRVKPTRVNPYVSHLLPVTSYHKLSVIKLDRVQYKFSFWSFTNNYIDLCKIFLLILAILLSDLR